ncbi:MAG: hypothetical protein JWO38_589, partial [Gemmataceae bacterium]|nr:hypothetical protein [Gemmataceae bacterium]
MSRPRWLILVPLLVVAAGLGSVSAGAGDDPGPPAMAVVGAAPLVTADAGPVDDPFPIARVRVMEAQLAGALKQFDPGAAVRLPRDEFELRVRKAGVVAAGARLAPRLVEAKYTATLSDANLTGVAEWVILNPGPQPAVLPLDPLRIALRAPTWADGSGAVVGTFGAGFPAGPGVWVPAPGRQSLKTKWSAAGNGGAGERQFEVRLPSCPGAVLDLDLPADRTPVTAAADVILTGPFPVAGDDKRRTWRFRFGDRARLEFGVRGPGDGGTEPALAALAARYDLTPGQTACAFEYDLRPGRGPVGEWAFTLSPGL